MSVDLMIWSNHKIKWGQTPSEVLQNIKNTSNLSVETFHTKEKEILGTTNQIDQIKYYSYTNSLQQDFLNNNEISIRTNYELCFEIRLLKTSCLINPRGFFTRWSSWKKVVTKEYIKEEPKERHLTYSEYHQKWMVFSQYLKDLVISLGGNEILYINDLSYQEPEDLFYKGEEFETVKSEFKRIGKCEPIEKLMQGGFDHELGQIWFNRNLGECS